MEQTEAEIRPQALLDVIQNCNRQNLETALDDESTNNIRQEYIDFQKQVRKGHLGKTARFWISFMDNAKLVIMLIYAVKTNKRELFHKCNGEMANLFFANDG